MIEFHAVSKSFWTGKKHKVILDKASFRVDPGRSLGILAPNGTGKTTLINMMAGLEKPDEGRITRTSRISFPLGFMGGSTTSIPAPRTPATSRGFTVLTRIMLRLSAAGCAELRNILTCRWALTARACARAFPFR